MRRDVLQRLDLVTTVTSTRLDTNRDESTTTRTAKLCHQRVFFTSSEAGDGVPVRW